MACLQSNTATNAVQAIRQQLNSRLASMLVAPTNLDTGALKKDQDPVKPCMYTFIDLGANVGTLFFGSSCVCTVEI